MGNMNKTLWSLKPDARKRLEKELQSIVDKKIPMSKDYKPRRGRNGYYHCDYQIDGRKCGKEGSICKFSSGKTAVLCSEHFALKMRMA